MPRSGQGEGGRDPGARDVERSEAGAPREERGQRVVGRPGARGSRLLQEGGEAVARRPRVPVRLREPGHGVRLPDFSGISLSHCAASGRNMLRSAKFDPPRAAERPPAPAAARSAVRRPSAGGRRAAARQTSATGSAGTRAGALTTRSGRRLGQRERRHQADAQATRDVGEQQRHARHVDGRHAAGCARRRDSRRAARGRGSRRPGAAAARAAAARSAAPDRVARAAGPPRRTAGRRDGGPRGHAASPGPSPPRGRRRRAATRRTPSRECVVTISKRTGGSSSSRSRSTGASSALPR